MTEEQSKEMRELASAMRAIAKGSMDPMYDAIFDFEGVLRGGSYRPMDVMSIEDRIADARRWLKARGA